MKISLMRLTRELRYQFGYAAALNLVSVLRGEIGRFVGPNGPMIKEYCEIRGLKL